MAVHRVFLSPGLFGFRVLGSYAYFGHIEQGILRRLELAGLPASVHVVEVHPTASIRRRAAALAAAIETHATPGEPIHLVGHSTGGLDARLIASPSVNVRGFPTRPSWHGQIRSVTTMSTPHYGTPLASFFATLSGQRLLQAVSALTVVGLQLGTPPLALAASLVASLGRIDRAVGVELRVIEGLTDRVVRTLDDATSAEVADWIARLRADQGAILQLTPEAMDLFQAGIEDAPGVRYQCVASWTPAPGVRDLARAAASPWAALSTTIFALLQRLTALETSSYPCSAPDREADRALRPWLGGGVPELASDGIVPVRSQVWGKVVWAGLADHLDVVGHFAGGRDAVGHVDWLASGAGFDRRRFDQILDAVVGGMIAAEG